jgi:hypothetical protein
MADPRVFISYAHSTAARKAWVKKLADALRRSPISVTLDQDDLHLGQLSAKFQRDGIAQADRVRVICSDRYVDRCDADPCSGVAQEKALMSIELQRNEGTKTEFREGGAVGGIRGKRQVPGGSAL